MSIKRIKKQFRKELKKATSETLSLSKHMLILNELVEKYRLRLPEFEKYKYTRYKWLPPLMNEVFKMPDFEMFSLEDLLNKHEYYQNR